MTHTVGITMQQTVYQCKHEITRAQNIHLALLRLADHFNVRTIKLFDMEILKCEQCHKIFESKLYDARGRHARFCSDTCRAQWHRDEAKRREKNLRDELKNKRKNLGITEAIPLLLRLERALDEKRELTLDEQRVAESILRIAQKVDQSGHAPNKKKR